MELRYVPLRALKAYVGGLRWHDTNVKAWLEVYRALGMVRPLVVHAANGHLLNPPGELEALQTLEADAELQPQGTLPDWRVPVWCVTLPLEDEPRWALVLAGGVDHALTARPYDDTLVDLLLDEAETDPNRVKQYGIDLKQYAALLEVLAAPDGDTLNPPISGSPAGAEWGIPALDLAMQADALYPAFQWGSAARSTDLAGRMVHFYTDDSKFSALVNDSAPVVAARPSAAVEVNFSTMPVMSRALVLYRTFQKRAISRRWQQAGIRLLVDLNVDYEFADINLYGVPEGWRAYAVRAYAKDLEHVEQAHEWAQARRGSDDLLYVVYGGGRRASELCSARGWAWVNEDSDERRGRYGAGTAQT